MFKYAKIVQKFVRGQLFYVFSAMLCAHFMSQMSKWSTKLYSDFCVFFHPFFDRGRGGGVKLFPSTACRCQKNIQWNYFFSNWVQLHFQLKTLINLKAEIETCLRSYSNEFLFSKLFVYFSCVFLKEIV